MVRPDCMQRTAELARAMHAPTWRHWAHAKHLLAYLKSTLDGNHTQFTKIMIFMMERAPGHENHDAP